MVAYTFGEYDKHLDNLSKPVSRLVLEGTQLRTEEGLIVAQLVEDQDQRLFWKPFIGNSLHTEVHIYGMGHAN